MIEIFKTMHLLFVEIVHFMRCYYLIIIQVYNFEPIIYTSDSGLILLTEHEPHKVLVVHLVLFFRLELAGHLVEDTVHCFPGECVTFIPGKILLVDQEVVVII